MQYFLYILIAIIVLLLMIVIHELGHYVAGRILRFKINEFSVGFGPKLFSKVNKHTGERFSLRLVPLGGYCAFEGEDDAGENEAKEDVNPFPEMENTESAQSSDSLAREEASGEKVLSFNEQKPWKRIIVLLAGAGFNFISAIIFSFIFILALGFNVPCVKTLYTDDSGVVYCSQLEVGDEILGVNGKRIGIMHTYDDLLPSKKNDGDVYDLLICRSGKEMTVSVTIKHIVNAEQKLDYTGLGFVQQTTSIKCDFGYALKYCVPYTVKLAFMVLSSLGGLITGSVPITSMTGPVGTVGFMAEVGMADARNFLILLPLLAANLAIFNVLPIPALDGSKIVFTVIEWIRKKPINRKIENVIHTVGILLLFAFVIVIDVVGLFT